MDGLFVVFPESTADYFRLGAMLLVGQLCKDSALILTDLEVLLECVTFRSSHRTITILLLIGKCH